MHGNSTKSLLHVIMHAAHKLLSRELMNLRFTWKEIHFAESPFGHREHHYYCYYHYFLLTSLA